VRLRPLAIVLALVAIDYAVWNWSLAGSRDVAGMVSGLTLPPLLVALLVLLAVNVMRVLGSATRRPTESSQTRRGSNRTSTRRRVRSGSPAIMSGETGDQARAASSHASPSRKIAA
jgi:hypothetical protein